MEEDLQPETSVTKSLRKKSEFLQQFPACGQSRPFALALAARPAYVSRKALFFTEESSMKIWSKQALGGGVASFALMCTVGFAQEKKDSGGHGIVHTAELKWTPIIKGCDLASVTGDMNADGAPFAIRLRCAPGTKIP